MEKKIMLVCGQDSTEVKEIIPIGEIINGYKLDNAGDRLDGGDSDNSDQHQFIDI